MGMTRNCFLCPIRPTLSPFRNRQPLAGGGKIKDPLFLAFITAIKDQRGTLFQDPVINLFVGHLGGILHLLQGYKLVVMIKGLLLVP